MELTGHTVQRPPEGSRRAERPIKPPRTRTPAVDSFVNPRPRGCSQCQRRGTQQSAAPRQYACWNSPVRGLPFLGVEFPGNSPRSTTDPEVRSPGKTGVRQLATDGPRTQNPNLATPTGRGVGPSRWPMAMISERGYATFALYYGDRSIPDFLTTVIEKWHSTLGSPTFHRAQLCRPQGKRPDRSPPGPMACPAFSTRSKQRQPSALTLREFRDSSVIRVWAKTALWGRCESIRRSPLVVATNSGCGGAAYVPAARSGERVGRIQFAAFPHGLLATVFSPTTKNEKRTPVDSHELVAPSGHLARSRSAAPRRDTVGRPEKAKKFLPRRQSRLPPVLPNCSENPPMHRRKKANHP